MQKCRGRCKWSAEWYSGGGAYVGCLHVPRWSVAYDEATLLVITNIYIISANSEGESQQKSKKLTKTKYHTTTK